MANSHKSAIVFLALKALAAGNFLVMPVRISQTQRRESKYYEQH